MEKDNNCACRCLRIPGFCFKPSDEELVGDYLRQKVEGRLLWCNHSIAEFKIYDDNLMPWEIMKDDDSHWITYSNDSSLGTIKKSTIYVFTELCKKNTRATRRSGGGSWKSQNTRFVENFAGDNIGYKKLLTFYEDDENNKGNKKTITYKGHGHWIMNQYSLPGIDNYVICKITKEVEISSEVLSCSSSINKTAATMPEFHSHRQLKEVDIRVLDVIVRADTILQRDVKDMDMVLDDERQLGHGDHNVQPLVEPGADWDDNGWQTELDKELGPDISDETSAQVVEELSVNPKLSSQVQSVQNLHVEDKDGEVVQELAFAVWSVNEKIYESGKNFDGAKNYEVIEILDDDDSIQELPMIRAADDPPKMQPVISVVDEAKINRTCINNIPDDDLMDMDGFVAFQETPLPAWEDLVGSTTINKISNDFSNFEHVETALAFEPTNTTQDGLYVMMDILFCDILNLISA